MKVACFLVVLLVMLSVVVNGQRQAKKQGGKNSASHLTFSERVFFGVGGLGGFASGIHPVYGFRYTQISINPVVGYRITMPWSAGLMINYATVRFPDQGLKIDQYGVSPFTQYRIGRLFGHAEYSFIQASTGPLNNLNKAVYQRFPIGIGYTLPLGKRTAISAMALYDVIWNKEKNAFLSPWVFRLFVTGGGVGF